MVVQIAVLVSIGLVLATVGLIAIWLERRQSRRESERQLRLWEGKEVAGLQGPFARLVKRLQ